MARIHPDDAQLPRVLPQHAGSLPASRTRRGDARAHSGTGRPASRLENQLRPGTYQPSPAHSTAAPVRARCRARFSRWLSLLDALPATRLCGQQRPLHREHGLHLGRQWLRHQRVQQRFRQFSELQQWLRWRGRLSSAAQRRRPGAAAGVRQRPVSGGWFSAKRTSTARPVLTPRRGRSSSAFRPPVQGVSRLGTRSVLRLQDHCRSATAANLLRRRPGKFSTSIPNYRVATGSCMRANVCFHPS
jgi:hypothetical protein